VVEVGEAGVDLEIFQMREDLDRGARQDSELHLGIASTKRSGKRLNHRQSGRDCRQTQLAGETVLEGKHFLAHGAGVTNDASRPLQYALAFRGEALKTGTAVDQQYAEAFFQLLHTSRQGRLGDPACLCRPPKMLLAGQGKEKFQFFKQRPPRM